MKIIAWGINYAPEPTGIGPFNTDLCAWLRERGHDVTMLTSFPYYPWWKKRREDRWKLFASEHGVRRCWHFVPEKPSTLKRLIHELSFVATSTVRALSMPAPDVYVVISPPLFMGIGARLVSLLKRRPYVFHVQDLQPDAALGLGMIKPGRAMRALYALERWTYRGAALVTGISEGMMNAFRSKGFGGEKIYLFPNWIPDPKPSAPNDTIPANSFRGANGINEETVLIAYSGNMGMKQGLEVVLEAASAGAAGRAGRAADEVAASDRAKPDAGVKLHWALCGDGAARPTLESRAAAMPGCAAKFYPLQSDAMYQSLLREVDVNLITQQRGTGQFFSPSKLLSILQFGRPVLAVADADSELARATHEGGFGKIVAPGDADGLRAAALELAHADLAQKKKWAERGQAWVSQFHRSRVLLDFERRLTACAEKQQTPHLAKKGVTVFP